MFYQLVERWKSGETHVALEGGESPEQVVERQKEAFDHILNQRNEELILVTMHGRAIRILLSHLLELPLQEMDKFEHSNTCLYILEYDYSVQRFELKLANDTSHIQAL